MTARYGAAAAGEPTARSLGPAAGLINRDTT
ncbi:uncharacterized protein SOCE836_101800 [Sorangium cellulosum]|uniref:Uncharacterized protein n=1 Tax=Sorangium cellulosum TaxID=56 RepID=A0A4V0NHV0_SORCE|nr:uncharacterized protein SOCE836_101800 [Sorangium cellulosum]WCQ97229.1 hypothetical protein NQZ70_10020 [Sorangium sp. Soce836]